MTRLFARGGPVPSPRAPLPSVFAQIECPDCDGRGFNWTMRGLFRTRYVAERCEPCYGRGTRSGMRPRDADGSRPAPLPPRG